MWVANWQDNATCRCAQAFERHMPDDERTALNTLRRESVRQRHLRSNVFLRATLSAYFPCTAQDWRFTRNPYGKPIIHAPHIPWPLCFNLSHTKGLTVCTVACHGDIGIDIEHSIPDFPAENSARDFAPCERKAIRTKLQHACPSRFFDYWTLKEAYLKALGIGLSGGLDRIAFDFGEGSELGIHFYRPTALDMGSWSFQLLACGPIRCAIARRQPVNSGFDLQYFHAFSGLAQAPWSTLARATARWPP